MYTFRTILQSVLVAGVVLVVSGCGNSTPDQSGVFQSTDAAANWTAQPDLTKAETKKPKSYPPLAVRTIAQHPTNADWLLAGTGSDLYQTEDNGATWQRLTTKLPSGGEAIEVNELAWQPGAPQTFYVAGVSSGYGKVYRTTDKGATFTDVLTTAEPRVAMLALAVRSDGSVVAGDRQGSVYASADGTTWRRTFSVGVPISTIQVVDRTTYLGTFGQGVFRSTDPNAGFSPINGVQTGDRLQITSLATMGGSLYTGTMSGIYRSRDGGASWQLVGAPFPVGGTAVQSVVAVPGALYVASNAVVYRLVPDTGEFRTAQLKLAESVFDLSVFPGDPSRVTAAVNNEDAFGDSYQTGLRRLNIVPGFDR